MQPHLRSVSESSPAQTLLDLPEAEDCDGLSERWNLLKEAWKALDVPPGRETDALGLDIAKCFLQLFAVNSISDGFLVFCSLAIDIEALRAEDEVEPGAAGAVKRMKKAALLIPGLSKARRKRIAALDGQIREATRRVMACGYNPYFDLREEAHSKLCGF
ncbi:hypothetical protein CYLTODRAFT_422935 [Cylindrobasidium torrendii FP15055 ss-10]|uniref:Uncharacterized protein n=1 Tax=Cylindrobasidium torrendii FP15055 ss-10 TaxID=1314674 RepID=A0A0D7B8V0_9AGAR|nr:hypothetical protein CYLTODRAFT_422935 [Cylindrobasidium torrendii FP15055 ss-10]